MLRLSRASAWLAALLAACGSGRSPPTPALLERVGELEVLGLAQVEAAGDTGLTTRYSRYALRWRGEPVAVMTAAGLSGDRRVSVQEFHAVYVLAGSAPGLIVLAGDPNNTGAFHRVSADADGVDTQLLCIVSTGENTVTLPGVGFEDARRFAEPQLQRIAAEQLLLGEHCVHAPATGALRVLSPLPEGLVAPSGWGPVLRRADGTTLARLLLDSDGAPVLGWTVPQALPDGLVAGSVEAGRWLATEASGWQLQPIERRRMRYASAESIDAVWIAHHYRWDDAAEAGLEVREDAAPLPYRGVLSPDRPEYRLHGLKAGQRERLVAVLIERLGGTRVAGRDETYAVEVRIGAQTLQVHDSGFYIAPAPQYWPGTPEDPAVQRVAMIGIAREFDAELATGTLDGMFDGEDAR